MQSFVVGIRGSSYPFAHGPGPPQRPHIPGMLASDLDLAELFSAPTANTLNERAVLVFPHFGHGVFSSAALIERTSFSNRSEQLAQVYS